MAKRTKGFYDIITEFCDRLVYKELNLLKKQF
ncbi:hypothetical protein IPdc08_00279 [archaeon]|nr:hypothetical protein IPdc08_00279 [archaeon]